MSFRKEFTQAEWKALSESFNAVWVCTYESDPNLWGASRELRAFLTAKNELLELPEYSENDLLLLALGASRNIIDSTGWEKLKTDGILIISETAKALSKVEPSIAISFKKYLLELAIRVASAAGEGWFGSNQRISAKEQAFIDKLQEILGI